MNRWTIAVLGSVMLALGLCGGLRAQNGEGDGDEAPAIEKKTLDTKQQAAQLADRFMTKLAGGDATGAFDDIAPYYAFEPKEILNGVKKPFLDSQEFIGKRFGAPAGQAFVKENGARDFIYSVEHALKYERHAMHWTFIFYKAKDTWVLTTLRYSDRAESFLD